MNLILGAGLAGLSASYHLGHPNCRLIEAKAHAYGHIHSEFLNGFTWDEGPHVSFTKSDYVKRLFAESVGRECEEYPVRTTNYFYGHWIDHPAQSNLYQVPEPLRSACVQSFLAGEGVAHAREPENYREWLERSLGRFFTDNFSAVYTRKYWTTSPENLTWRWVGPRVFRPRKEDVLMGAQGALPSQTHYITKVRYPRRGGYQAFAHQLAAGAQINLNTVVIKIDLAAKKVVFNDGTTASYSFLVNSLPLPVFIGLCQDVPLAVRSAVEALSCSSLLLVNVEVAHPTARSENWIYVYDENKWSTRINCTEKLSSENAPAGCSGIQVEVYFSTKRPQLVSDSEIANKVLNELIEMGLVKLEDLSIARPLPNPDHTMTSPLFPPGTVRWFTRKVPWANVIFDHQRESALNLILDWLESFGLVREVDDLEPVTVWKTSKPVDPSASIVMAGRFAQWKYFWTDDCVLRGKQVSTRMRSF